MRLPSVIVATDPSAPDANPLFNVNVQSRVLTITLKGALGRCGVGAFLSLWLLAWGLGEAIVHVRHGQAS